MKTLRYARSFLAVALLATAALSTTAHGATRTLESNFDGLQMTPPNASPAYGLATLTLDDVTGDFTVVGNYYDLLGSSSAVHLHGPAAPGAFGAFIMTLTLDTPGAATGTFSAPGGSSLSLANITNALADQLYIDIHSSVFPSGELRGQLFVVPEPSSIVLAAVGLLTAWIFRRKICPARS